MQKLENNYEFEFCETLAKIDMRAIDIVKQMKDDVLFVRDTFRKYGITRDSVRPYIPLKQLIDPQSIPPSKDEIQRFEEAEKNINASVNKPGISIPLSTAIAANIEMIYWDPCVTFENIDQTVIPVIPYKK